MEQPLHLRRYARGESQPSMEHPVDRFQRGAALGESVAGPGQPRAQHKLGRDRRHPENHGGGVHPATGD